MVGQSTLFNTFYMRVKKEKKKLSKYVYFLFLFISTKLQIFFLTNPEKLTLFKISLTRASAFIYLNNRLI